MKYIVSVIFLAGSITLLQGQYIDEVFSYRPAPGQFINTEGLGTIEAANSIKGETTGMVSLGSFGGEIVFSFDKMVENDPKNPFGIDFVLYGNAFTGLSEAGIVYVMEDQNSNGLPDETWYEIAGSDYFLSDSKDYTVTYFNPKSDEAVNVPWRDLSGETGIIKKNDFYDQPYYPLEENFPQINQDSFSVSGSFITSDIYTNQNGFMISEKRKFGYADNQLRGNTQSDIPDNPYDSDLTGMGGDGIDLNWAVDSFGNYISLEEIKFVKIQTAALQNLGAIGEFSTEISQAVDVKSSNEQQIDFYSVFLRRLPRWTNQKRHELEILPFINGRYSPDLEFQVKAEPEGIEIIGDSLINFTRDGMYTIKVSLINHPEAKDEITINYEGPNSIGSEEKDILKFKPNPFQSAIIVSTPLESVLSIYEVSGKMVYRSRVKGEKEINLESLPNGMYFLKCTSKHSTSSHQIIKI